MLLALAALGCGDPAPGAPPDPTAPLDPSPWTLPETATALPPVDPARLSRALDQAIVAVLAYDALPVVTGYDAFWSSADPACPAATVDPYGNVYWADGCTASDGTFFGGYASRYVTTDLYDDDAGVWIDGIELSGNVVLTGPAGTYDLEGGAAWYTGSSADGQIRLVQSALVGGFAWDGPAASGWLRDAGLAGASVEVTLVGYNVADTALVVIVDGAVAVEVDGEPWHVVFELAQLANEAAGTTCGDEPGGTVAIRDPHGRWVDVTFHGPDVAYGSTLGDALRCDGCGDASADGEDLGAVCGDFDPWYAWEAIR